MENWLQDNIQDINLRDSIQKLITEHPDSASVIQQLIDYYQNKLGINNSAEDHTNKKRKIATDPKDQKVIASIPDISFQLPSRKKYTLVLTSQKLQLISEKSQQIEHEYILSFLNLCVCVPTPDKPQGSFTFSLFPSSNNNTEGLSSPSSPQPPSVLLDAIVFNILDKGALNIKQHEKEEVKTYTSPQEKKQAIIDLFLLHVFKNNKGNQQNVITPSRQTYTCSGVSPTTGKPEMDRTFVNTYLRNKEGVLYFLPNGILYGFKKPTLFIPTSFISATMITNITKRTFDLTIQLFPSKLPLGNGDSQSSFYTPFLQQQERKKDDDENNNDHKKEESASLLLPFSMIEQTEYAGIEAYIQKVGIKDQSMTEATKAPEPLKSSKDQYKNDDDDDGDEEMKKKQDHGKNIDEEDEEDDEDFMPGNNSDDDDDDVLEYDSNASDDEDEDDDHHGKDGSMDGNEGEEEEEVNELEDD
ncbi:hypothetical protein BJ944DRAFT_272523 [Cunninghamella echinulata]|nr:hypothetical protein BJ944DRAFT_272523 [Cunninghamella echinulata]